MDGSVTVWRSPPACGQPAAQQALFVSRAAGQGWHTGRHGGGLRRGRPRWVLTGGVTTAAAFWRWWRQKQARLWPRAASAPA